MEKRQIIESTGSHIDKTPQTEDPQNTFNLLKTEKSQRKSDTPQSIDAASGPFQEIPKDAIFGMTSLRDKRGKTRISKEVFPDPREIEDHLNRRFGLDSHQSLNLDFPSMNQPPQAKETSNSSLHFEEQNLAKNVTGSDQPGSSRLEPPTAKQQALFDLIEHGKFSPEGKEAAAILTKWRNPNEFMLQTVDFNDGTDKTVQVKVAQKNETGNNSNEVFTIPARDYKSIKNILSAQQGDLEKRNQTFKDYKDNEAGLKSYMQYLLKHKISPSMGVYGHQEMKGDFGPFVRVTVANKEGKPQGKLDVSIAGFDRLSKDYLTPVSKLDNVQQKNYEEGWRKL